MYSVYKTLHITNISLKYITSYIIKGGNVAYAGNSDIKRTEELVDVSLVYGYVPCHPCSSTLSPSDI